MGENSRVVCALVTCVLVTQPNAAPQNLSMLMQTNRTEVEQLTYVKENLT